MRMLIAAILGFAGVSTAASAQEVAPPAILQDVYNCAQVSGDAARLACYDAAVGRLQSAQSQGQFTAVDREQVQQLGREAFGLPMPSLPRIFGRDEQTEVVDEMHLEIAEVRRSAEGRAVLTMTNGQIWRQVEGSAPRQLRAGRAVTIRRAAFGSFLLSGDGIPAAVRVRRQE